MYSTCNRLNADPSRARAVFQDATMPRSDTTGERIENTWKVRDNKGAEGGMETEAGGVESAAGLRRGNTPIRKCVFTHKLTSVNLQCKILFVVCYSRASKPLSRARKRPHVFFCTSLLQATTPHHDPDHLSCAHRPIVDGVQRGRAARCGEACRRTGPLLQRIELG